MTIDDRLEQRVVQHLGEGPLTLDALHRRLASDDPTLVAYGPSWLHRWLTTHPQIRQRRGQFELRPAATDDDDEFELQIQESPAPDVDRSLADDYVVLDIETNPDRTNVAEHEIIEIAAVRVTGGTVADEFHTFAAPTRLLTDLVTQLTGLTQTDLDGAPRVEDALARLSAFVETCPLVAHNGFGYDYLVLDAAYASHELEPLPGPRLDTLELAHVVFPRAGAGVTADVDGSPVPPARTLEALSQFLQVATEDQTHRAADDVHLLVSVLARLIARASDSSPRWSLVRHTLARAQHPWAAFLPPATHDEDFDLLAVVPAPPEPSWPEPTGQFAPAEVMALLEPDGGLLAGRSHRPSQVQMTESVALAFARGDRLLVEAPTGTGKTLAYLAPAVAYSRAAGVPVVVSTHSKVLQNQVLASIPDLERVFGELTVVLLKGKENYCSVEALADALESPLNGPDDGLALAIVASWVAVTPTGEWDDLRVWAIQTRVSALGRLEYELRVEDDGGIAHDDLEARCFYRRARTGVADADVAVINHAVMVSRTDWREDVTHLVVDEAHNLEEAATGAFTEEVTRLDVIRLLDRIHPPRGRHGLLRRWTRATRTSMRSEAIQDLRQQLAIARGATEDLTSVLTDFLRERAGARRAEVEQFGASVRLVDFERRRPAFAGVRTGTRTLIDELRALAERLEELEIPESTRPRERRRLERQIARVARECRATARVLWGVVMGSSPTGDAEPDGEDTIPIADLTHDGIEWSWGVRAVPLSVGGRLAEVWNELQSVVLTSATLRVRESFSFIQGRLGLSSATTRALDTPFTHLREDELVVLTSHLPPPTGHLVGAFTTAQSDELARLLTLTHGRALALFAARARMNHARDHVRPLLDQRGIAVLCQGEAPTPALIERMQSELSTSLLATRSFWEGVDVPGENLSLLVIEKLPFDSPGDPIVAARMEQLELQGKDPFEHYLVPQAAIRFAQGVGRLIRTAEDRGVVVVLDRRLRDPKPYRDAFLSALPGDPTIIRPDTAEAAYRRIAEFLHLPWDDTVQALLAELPTSDEWGFLAELQISDEEAKDEELVRTRLDVVRERLGFPAWRPGQEDVMVRLIRGDDVLAILPTGFGKSITYQVPALLRPGVTIVVSPLIALMRDQVRTLQQRGVHSVAAIESGVGQAMQEQILAEARQGRIRILYVSPERLWSQRFRTAIASLEVARVIVDEAHCVSQWGHSFRPEYAAITDAIVQIARDQASPPSTGAFTATATDDVQIEVRQLLGLDDADDVISAPDRPELQYHVVDCADKDARDLAVVKIVEAFREQSVIVYVPTQKDTLRLARLLRHANHRARPYHGGMEAEERIMVEESFLDDEVAVVVATKAFGLGIDKPDIAAVVHLEMPASVEEYVQETGRAARGAREGDGPATGACVLLRSPGDCHIHGMFTRTAAPKVDLVRAVWDATHDGWCQPLSEIDDTQSEDALALSTAYLVRDGALERREDVAWQGRVYLPPDADDVVSDLERTEPVVAAQMRDVVGTVRRLGSEEYHADRWMRATGRSAAEVEADLLEATRRGILTFHAWVTAWQLEPAGRAPNWARIEQELKARREKVKRLSATARAYRDVKDQCRRSWLLWYLDADADGQCDGCDVCVPDLPRPWEDVDIDLHSVGSAVDPELVALRAVQSLEEWGFSRRTVELMLDGAPLKFNRHLVDDPLYGALAHLRSTQIAATLDGLVTRGHIESRFVARGDGQHETLTLTAEGRRRLS